MRRGAGRCRVGCPRPVPVGPGRPRRPGVPDGERPGRRARRPAGGCPGRTRADDRALSAVDRHLHGGRLDRRVLRRAGVHRIRGDRGRAARADRGPAAGRDPALPAGAAVGRRTGSAATPGRVRGDVRGGHRGDARLPGPPGGLGLAGVQFPRLRGAGRRTKRNGARGDRGRRHPGIRRDRRPAEFRSAGSSRRVRGDGSASRPDLPGLDGRKQAAAEAMRKAGHRASSARGTGSTGGSTATTRSAPTPRIMGPIARSAPG